MARTQKNGQPRTHDENRRVLLLRRQGHQRGTRIRHPTRPPQIQRPQRPPSRGKGGLGIADNLSQPNGVIKHSILRAVVYHLSLHALYAQVDIN